MRAVECREAVDLTLNVWNNHIAKGVIKKEKDYDPLDVMKQISRHKSTLLQALKTEKGVMTRKLDKANKDLLMIQMQINDDSSLVEKRMTKKEKQDFEIGEQKLVRAKHDNAVRQKLFIPREMFVEFITSIASEFAGMLEPIPIDLKQLIPSMTSRIFNGLKKSMAEKRNLLADHISGKTTDDLLRKFDPERSIAVDDPTTDT